MADNGITIRQSDIVQDNQAVHKACATNTLSQNHDMLRTRLVKVIHSPHRLALKHKLKENILTLPPPVKCIYEWGNILVSSCERIN